MISEEEIQAADETLSGMSDSETMKLIKSFQKKQEPLLVYLAAVIEREGLNEDEQDLLTTSTILSWRIIHQHFPSLRTVSMEEIEVADNLLFSTLENFDQMNENQQMSYGTKILEEYPQRELLGYVSEKVMADEQVRDETKGLIFLMLKNAIDLLIQASA